MKHRELKELHYITDMNNVPSILCHGILSNRRAKTMKPVSVAMKEIQEARAKVRVQGGLPLHDYVNLYISARNPMLYKLKDKHLDLCVLRVNTDILALPGVVISDRNAACRDGFAGVPRFLPGPQGLSIVDRDLVFAEFWMDSDPVQQAQKKAAKCAEVLVPHRVPPVFIFGTYVSCREAKTKFLALKTGLSVSLNSDLFFMAGG